MMVHLGSAVLLYLDICWLLIEWTVIKAQELSMFWATNFSFRSFSKWYLADRLSLEHKNICLVCLVSVKLLHNIWPVNLKFLKLILMRISYRICSVICSATRSRRGTTPSVTSLSLSSPMFTSSCSLSEGTRFFLQTTQYDYVNILIALTNYCFSLQKIKQFFDLGMGDVLVNFGE